MNISLNHKRINDRTIIADASYKMIELEELFQLKIKESKEEGKINEEKLEALGLGA